jgi:hypothetical protein
MDKRLREDLKALHCSNASDRDDAASDLGYVLEHIASNHYAVEPSDLNECVQALLAGALAEQDPDVKETLFSSLVDAAMTSAGPSTNWDSIASILPNLSEQLLEYAIIILGFSHNPAYKGLIATYLQHSSSDIRRVAKEALVEFKGEKISGAGDTAHN